MIVGITGPSGAGKSHLSTLLAARGFAILDCDKIYHELISSPGSCVTELCEQFGPAVLNINGGIDRNALGRIVFSSPGALLKLNSITHKYIIDEIKSRIDALRPGTSAVIDAPTLFEAGCDALCDLTIGVLASRQTRTARLIERDGAFKTAEELEARMNASKPELFYTQRCDMIWVNDREDASAAEFADRIAALCTGNGPSRRKIPKTDISVASNGSESDK